MMKIRFYEKEGCFIEEGDDIIKYLSPKLYHIFRVPLELRIRLISSRSGVAARWSVDGVAEKCLNESPYNPVFRGFVKSLYYSNEPITNLSPNTLEANHVLQLGHSVVNWYAYVDRPVEDIHREEAHKIKEGLLESKFWVILGQGDLLIARVSVIGDIYNVMSPYNEIFIGDEKIKNIYDHNLHPPVLGWWRVISGTTYGILTTKERLIVGSAEKQYETLFLPKGVYVFTHKSYREFLFDEIPF